MSYRDPILFATLTRENPVICLCHVGRDMCESDYCYGPAIRKFYLIHYIISGKGTYIARHCTYHLQAGDAFIIYPEEITTYTADTQEPWEYCFFAFKGEMANDMLNRTGFADGNMVLSLNDDLLREAIEETANTLLSQETENNDIYALSQLFKIFYILASHSTGTTPVIRSTKKYVEQAMNYISFNYRQQLTIAGLANMLSLNRSYFYRIFKSEVGISPMEYLNNYRLDLAKELLIKSNTPISEIALAVGFNTFSSFYRLFSLKYDLAPRQYRNLYNTTHNVAGGV